MFLKRAGNRKGLVSILTYKEFYEIANVEQHSEFESYLKRIVFDKNERDAFYTRLLDINPVLSVDTFKPYFELYSAERKSNMQDYTPDAVASLIAKLTRSDAEDMQNSKYAAYDMTAGSGSLLIQKWNDDRIQETPWSYAPHRYLYRGDELADNVIPYLIHNLAIRGMNAIVVHGNALEGQVKQIYFIQNSHDDFMAFSDVNVMPHSDDATREFGVKAWKEDAIDYKESGEVIWNFALPMKRKRLETQEGTPGEYIKQEDILTLGDVADVERAKAKKAYPLGTIVVQMSATKGQIGLLESDGEVPSHYACAIPKNDIHSGFLFYMLKRNAPKHFHRVQEGLNLKLEDIATIPVAIPTQTMTIAEIFEMNNQAEQLSLL